MARNKIILSRASTVLVTLVVILLVCQSGYITTLEVTLSDKVSEATTTNRSFIPHERQQHNTTINTTDIAPGTKRSHWAQQISNNMKKTAASNREDVKQPMTNNKSNVKAYWKTSKIHGRGLSPKNTTEECRKARLNFREVSGLYAIVTGTEHSGTTAVSRLIMSAPEVYGGAECGILAARTPRNFIKVQPFYDWMLRGPELRMWGLTKQQRINLVQSNCHAEMFQRLKQMSPLFSKERNACAMPSWRVVDKTPRYIRELRSVMARAPGVPVVVTVKSDALLRKSYEARKKKEPGQYYKSEQRIASHIQQGKDGLADAMKYYPHLIHVVNVTELYQDPSGVMQKVFQFLNLTWHDEYFSMDALNKKWVGGTHDPPFVTARLSAKAGNDTVL